MKPKLHKLVQVEYSNQFILYQTQGAEGSQPAMKIQRSEYVNKTYKIKDVNVHVNVMFRCE
jgi:hypothetical protein